MIGGLVGIRVVDLTTNVSGPFATQILGDLGAEVIKVERPGGGDDTRGWGPPFWGDGEESVTFSTLNRNKRSVVLDLRADGDREVLDRMIAGADVLVQNMRPGAFERLGYTWQRLQDLNERLVYCEITGFGKGGPRDADPAYDPLMQAYSGLMSLVGEEGRPPVRIPVSILDRGTGMWAAIGILNALRLRDGTGVGSRVSASLLETALQWEPNQLAGYMATGQVPVRLGSGAPGIAPYEAFATADRHIIIAAGNQRLWTSLCRVLQREELLDDPRFVDNATRFRYRDELREELHRSLSQRNADELLVALAGAGIPASPINTIDAVVAEEQVQAVGALERVPHPTLRDYTLVHAPLLIDGERFPIERRPPALDADGAQVLEELGFDASQIAALRGEAHAG